MSPSENIQYDFEWRPLNNYLAVQRITPPDMRQGSAAEPRLPSEALYEWIVLNGRSPLEGLSLGEHYRLSDYGVAGLALQSAGTVGEAFQLIKTNMLLFRKDIRGIVVRRSSCDTVDVDIDLQDYDFHLDTLSTLRGKAMPVDGITDNRDGTLRGDTLNIGCY